MSDRWVFLFSLLSVVFIAAGAFTVVPLFWFETLKATIFLAIALLVFFGENQYSFMLGLLAPIVWLLTDTLLGGFTEDLRVLANFLTNRGVPPLDTPLHGISIFLEIGLAILSFQAWRKQVEERLFGKTFVICLAISLVYCAVLVAYYLHAFVGHRPFEVGRIP